MCCFACLFVMAIFFFHLLKFETSNVNKIEKNDDRKWPKESTTKTKAKSNQNLQTHTHTYIHLFVFYFSML